MQVSTNTTAKKNIFKAIQEEPLREASALASTPVTYLVFKKALKKTVYDFEQFQHSGIYIKTAYIFIDTLISTLFTEKMGVQIKNAVRSSYDTLLAKKITDTEDVITNKCDLAYSPLYFNKGICFLNETLNESIANRSNYKDEPEIPKTLGYNIFKSIIITGEKLAISENLSVMASMKIATLNLSVRDNIITPLSLFLTGYGLDKYIGKYYQNNKKIDDFNIIQQNNATNINDSALISYKDAYSNYVTSSELHNDTADLYINSEA